VTDVLSSGSDDIPVVGDMYENSLSPLSCSGVRVEGAVVESSGDSDLDL
jgi:hypothetical protein